MKGWKPCSDVRQEEWGEGFVADSVSSAHRRLQSVRVELLFARRQLPVDHHVPTREGNKKQQTIKKKKILPEDLILNWCVTAHFYVVFDTWSYLKWLFIIIQWLCIYMERENEWGRSYKLRISLLCHNRIITNFALSFYFISLIIELLIDFN